MKLQIKKYLGYNVVNNINEFIKWRENNNYEGELGFVICIGNPHARIREKSE